MESVVRHRNRLPRDVVKSPFLEAFKKMCKCGAWRHGLVVGFAVLVNA